MSSQLACAKHAHSDTHTCTCTHTKTHTHTHTHIRTRTPKCTQVLIKERVHTFSMRSGLTESDFGWGTPTFAKMGREKIRLIRVFLELGVTVVISDVDVLWLK